MAMGCDSKSASEGRVSGAIANEEHKAHEEKQEEEEQVWEEVDSDDENKVRINSVHTLLTYRFTHCCIPGFRRWDITNAINESAFLLYEYALRSHFDGPFLSDAVFGVRTPKKYHTCHFLLRIFIL